MQLENGSTIGDYQVVGTLGEGGMGKVYKVRNVISDRIEAMKILLPDLVSTPELADRFLREIKVLASLDHPNVAQLHTAVRAGNQLLMVMEFIDGESLDHLLKKGPLPLPRALDCIAQVLSALDFAHGRGVIHRDIKPANMMLTQSGVVKLMDFGIAKAAADQKLTMTGTTVGSVYYMSPEQIQGATTLDARADLYSVGVTLYELVTGKRPFDGDSQYAIMAAHLQTPPVPPITVDPKLPEALNELILISVAKDPKDRFQSAAAFRNALTGVAAQLQPPAPAPAPSAAASTVAAPAPVPVAAAAPPQAVPAAAPRSKRWLWVATGGIAAVAAIVCAIEFVPWKSTRAAVPSTPAPVAQTAQAPPASQPAPQTTAPADAAATPAATPQAAPPVETPAATPVATPPAATPKPAPSRPSPKTVVATAEPHTSAPPQPAPQTAPQTPPPQQAVAPPVPAQAPPQAMAPPGPSPVEIRRVRDRLDKLQVRANTVHDSLNSLLSSMQAQGLGLSSKFTQPAGLMDTYLRSAGEAFNQADLPATRSYAEKAEHQIEILEKLLNL